ncbi:MAG TPA: ATP-binding protein [Acidobacteriaceae bacterium]|jgi:PAS domain S-box-containing protein|nr:ATP-binding protein [Acidobacteriaceae bacterium]
MPRSPRISVLLSGYLGAVLLPWLGVTLTLRTTALHGTPVALSYIFVAGITVFTGLGPGLLSVVCTAVYFNYLVLPPSGFVSLDPQSLLYTTVILAIGFFIALLCHRQRVTRSRLGAALTSLQIRTDALTEAQQASNSAVWTFTLDNGHLHWAEGGALVFGQPVAPDAIPQATADLIVDEDRARVFEEYDQAIAAGRSFRSEFRVRWPNGEIHWLESRGTPSAVNTNIWRGVTLDITDRKNAELALVRSEKLAAIGRLSATIAHEVNNPLEAVTNLLYLAQTEPNLPTAARDYLHRADQELARLGGIARRTLTFVRPKSSPGPVHALEIVEAVVGMFQPRCATRGAEIRVLHNGDLRLAISPDDLRQILTNLVSNACDALPESGGRIEIEIAPAGSMAALSVRDNGSGIAPDNIARIFDPFFTTKEDVGTGIGLWVTKDLVEKNGGRIGLDNHNLPEGFRTAFCVELPCA